jgi:hypothetical protein
MAKPPKKQTTLQEDLTSTISTVKDTVTELTELSQELGLYDVEGNPLIKNTPTTSQEATESTSETFEGESNTVVTPEPQNASEASVEPLQEFVDSSIPLVDEKLSLKDGWGRPLPTVAIVIQSVNYTDLVSQALYLAYLGAELDVSYRVMTVLPYRVRLLLPAENYAKWLSKEDQMVYNEDTTYNRVLVKSYDLYGFWKNIIKIGKNGSIVQPKHVAQKVGGYMVPCLTRSPVADTPESRLGIGKIKYDKSELESFTLESLKIVGDWYSILPSNSKLKYIRAIMDKQGS